MLLDVLIQNNKKYMTFWKIRIILIQAFLVMWLTITPITQTDCLPNKVKNEKAMSSNKKENISFFLVPSKLHLKVALSNV